LRALLGGWRSGADRLVECRDGIVRIADDATACVIELPRTAEPTEDSLAERVAAYLAATGETSPAELASRVGVSRSGLLQTLRGLVAEGRVERIGQARAVRYRATS
jgi:DNA-binding GntR family transcriptional regulator